MSVSVLLLAAGLGTRLRPLTDTVPKCLVPVRGRPLADYWLDRITDAGIRRVRINTHHLPDQVRAWAARRAEDHGIAIEERFESTLLGSAGTVTANRDLADDSSEVVIVYADNFSTVDLAAMLDAHRGHAASFTMLLFRTDTPEQCGIAEVDEDMRVVRFTEKPARPQSTLANGGVYVVDAALYREMADRNGFDIAFDLLPGLVGRMYGWLTPGYHRDIGTPEALAAVERMLDDDPSLVGCRS